MPIQLVLDCVRKAKLCCSQQQSDAGRGLLTEVEQQPGDSLCLPLPARATALVAAFAVMVLTAANVQWMHISGLQPQLMEALPEPPHHSSAQRWGSAFPPKGITVS